MFTIDDFLSYATGSTTTRPTAPRPSPTTRPRPVTRPEPVPARQTAVLTPPAPSLELVAYSDKAFAVFGDTKPLADQLGKLGGRFNRFLKRDGVQTPGWIFSNSRKDAVRKAFNI